MDVRDVVPSARHVGIDEIPFVTNPTVGARMRLLQVDPDQGLYVLHGIMPPGLRVGTHRHRGPVLAFTLSGAWGYLENDFVNRAGSYLYEPPESVHTLYVPDDAEPTEMVSAIFGDVEYLDENGDVTYVSNWRANLDLYYQACEAEGLPRPSAIIR